MNPPGYQLGTSEFQARDRTCGTLCISLTDHLVHLHSRFLNQSSTRWTLRRVTSAGRVLRCVEFLFTLMIQTKLSYLSMAFYEMATKLVACRVLAVCIFHSTLR